MNNVIVSTGYKLAQSVVANGQITGNPWQNPQNVFLSDGLFAASNPAESAASDFIVGNFAMGIPSDAVITGFLIKILGKQGAQTVPPLTLTISAVDNISGPEVFYPYTAPYTGLNPNNEEHILGGANYLFDTTWTATQANNIKLAFQANGDISLDSVSVNALYYVPGAAPSPDPLPEGCEECNSIIQVQKMTLKVAFKVTDTEFIIAPGAFAYADGTPVQPGDLGTCGGEIDFVFDQGLRKPIDGNFAENVVFFSDTGSWVVLGDGSTKFTLGSFTDRGRQFHEPYGHVPSLVSGHAANSEVVISNNGRFYSRFVRRCQEDIVFSPPITVQDEGSDVVTTLHTLNFRGDDVQAEQASGDIHFVNVDILTNPTNVSPEIEDSNEGTTGSTPATSISIPLTIVAANYLRIWISSQDESTPTVTFDGVPATIIGSKTHGSADLKAFLFDLVSPNSGAHNVVITFGSAINFSAGAVSFLDVDIANPVDGVSSGDSGNGTAPTDTLTTTIENSLAQDVVAVMANPTLFTQGSLWTIRSQVNAASYPGASSTRKVLIPGTVTDTYSIAPTGDWVILLAGVRGNTNPLVGVQSVTDDGNGHVTVDNTDPSNPIIGFDGVSSDGTSITGTGLPGDPLVATAGPGASQVKVDGSDTTAGYLDDKIEIVSADSSVTIVKTIQNPAGNEKISYDLSANGGSGSLAGAFSYLPLGKLITAGAGDGVAVGNNVFADTATKRIYAILGTGNIPSLRIFKNDYGTYYQENEVTITQAMLSVTTGNVISEISWTCDSNYLYAMVNYEKSTATTFQRIDVVRFDLDGTNPIATNIFAQSPIVTNSRNYIAWEQGLSNAEYRACTIVGTSLFTTWTRRTGASTYVQEFREYTISGTTYTLINTYTVTSTNNTVDAFNVRYDVTNDCFYFGGNNSVSEPLIDKYVITGSNIAFDSSQTYTEFGYGNNKPNGIVNDGFNISSVIDHVTYNEIYVVQTETGSSGSLGAGATSFSYRLFVYNMPKF